MVKRIAILGSTGSIGTQALEVIDQHPAIFEVEVLTAMSQADLLISQAIKYKPSHVVIGDESKYELVRNALFLQEGKGFLHRIAIFYAVNFHCFFPFNDFPSCFLHALEGPDQSVHLSKQWIKISFQTVRVPNKRLASTCFGNSDRKVGCRISLPIQNL